MHIFERGIPEWAADRTWWLYIPVLILMIYIPVRHIADPLYQNMMFGGINLVIHEAGHFILGFAGQFIGVLGGSLFEIAWPLLFMVSFIRQGQYFSIAFSLTWLSTALFSVGTYAMDAQEQALPLIADGLIHDWNWLLSTTGLLAYDNWIGGFLRFSGAVNGVLGIGLGVYFIWTIWKHNQLKQVA